MRDDPGSALCEARGFAITQYAYYEEALACLFAELIGLTPAIAGIPFFKINNARSRAAIMERLLKKKYGSKYSVFWNSLAKELQKLDNQRNNVVHWTMMITHFAEPVASLVPPNYWDEDKNTPSLLLADLVKFADKCNFFVSTICAFTYTLQDRPFVHPTWPEIFLRPVTYPPQEGHPLGRKP